MRSHHANFLRRSTDAARFITFQLQQYHVGYLPSVTSHDAVSRDTVEGYSSPLNTERTEK